MAVLYLLTTTVIIALTLLMFIYWLRYACNLMLSVHPSKDLTAKISEANKIEVPLCAIAVE